MELFDRRLGSRLTYQVLGMYSGGTHLAILVNEPEESGIPADWADEKTLRAALGEELDAVSTLSIWDSMARLMPLASRFVMKDLMPHGRARLLSAMVRDVCRDLKSHARDLFCLNQHLLMTNRSSGAPLTWEERFIFRVMGEAELTRILAPSASGKPVNMTALACLINRRGLVGMVKDEAVMPELSADFLVRSFRTLTVSAAPGRFLDEMAAFIRLIREEDFTFDMWESQNLWYGLINDPVFMNRLKPDEVDVLREIGDLLGFAGMKKPRLSLVPSKGWREK